jgi:translation initiation factor 2B subunit (eIF-2B alpha/beta/delta family)
MNPRMAERISEIKNDKVHGAGWLAQQAINTLTLAITESRQKDVAGFIHEIKSLSEELVKARPSMVSIANYINQFSHDIREREENNKDLKSLKAWAEARGTELVELSEKATERVIEYGGGIISTTDTIISCSYSSTVCASLELAKDNEEKFHVMVAASKFQDKAYGEITASELKQHGIPAEVISDESMPSCIARADKAIIGADSILADGSLINGMPSLALAQAAREVDIPFFAVCETAKFDIQGYIARVPKLESGLEKVPANLITGIITEKGIMAPGMTNAYMAELARSFK